MYINHEERKAKIGKVSVSVDKRDTIRLRFTYPKGNRNEINLATNTEEGWLKALQVATIINSDIELGNFDETLAKYSPLKAQKLEIANRKPNLIDLWNDYKKVSKDRVAATTIKRSWNRYESNYLTVPSHLLELDKAREYVAYLLEKYALGTIRPFFSNCLMPSVNLAVRTGKIDNNPYQSISLGKKSKRPIEAYEPQEIKLIVSAFYSDKYLKKSSRYKHSYYAPMVDFHSLVGCRPSELHALTWDDIKVKNDRKYIRFNKAYSNNILLGATKNHEIRLFPINQQLDTLLERIPRIENDNNLIFPAINRGYVNQRTFSRRYWNTVIKGLIADKLLTNNYRNYSLRHSFITRLVRQGVDIATIGRLSGNSPETIMNHYLASKDDFELPPLL